MAAEHSPSENINNPANGTLRGRPCNRAIDELYLQVTEIMHHCLIRQHVYPPCLNSKQSVAGIKTSSNDNGYVMAA